jgi:hypothetical protein
VPEAIRPCAVASWRSYLLASIALVFLTSTVSHAVPPDEGPGGPILVISSPSNPFTRYYAEILRNEGLNGFAVADIGTVSSGTLAAYDVVVLGEMSLTGAQVTMLSNWVNAGGNLIAMRPAAGLASLLGINPQVGTLSNAYLLINTASEPGTGLVAQTIQFHGAADLYTLGSATSLATLYSNASTATANPAVTVRNVGSNGGKAAAFTYDLARSVVYTRQGNPAWSGQERDGIGPIRADDLFYGAAAGDPQPDWINLDKVAIPQADEQQRLLANMILTMNRERKPLPRFWYFPRDLKAVVIMTGDQHGCCAATVQRFQIYVSQSPSGCSVEDWECVRASSYVYASNALTNAEALSWHNQGFELGYHIDTGCANWTPASLNSNYSSQLATFASLYPSIPLPDSNRTHCIVWSDWSTQATVQRNYGIRLDTNYYFWPPGWVLNRPGMFTGSGMPMRFAQTNGTIIDVYQAVTQMTDESNQTYPFTIDTLLDRALGAEGYYGAFTANMHTDTGNHAGSNAIVASALARGVPVVSGRQMLEWLDGRNNSTFDAISWNVNVLSFGITPAQGSRNLRAMIPTESSHGDLSGITRNGNPVAYDIKTIKGIEYAVFDGASGNYVATYLVPGDMDGDGYAPPDDCDDANPAIHPGATESCNGIDDDCDGQIDETFADLGNGCSAGVGACFASGVRVCAPSGTSTQCNAVPGTPSAELCDGIDNDCDGQTDENFPDLGSACSVGVGACQANGTKVCAGNGSGTVCNAVAGTPTTEVCDGIDNDCDGSIDEGTSGGICATGQLGACAVGTVLCQGGVPQCVAQTPPTAETCNGIDDDCDGVTDEGNPGGGGGCTTGLLGVCQEGTYQCQGGILQCVAVSSSAEICDGLDNDCDGLVDEGTGGGSCSTGMSECPTGVVTCVSGAPACDPTGVPCDDSDACTANDVCDASGQCAGQPTCSLCPDTPATDCLEAARSSFQMRDDGSDGKDQLRWRWTRGAEVTYAQLGDPATTTAYALCVYDRTGGVAALVASSLVPNNGAWRGRDPKGWQFKDKAGAFDGAQKIQLKTGVASRSKAQWGARGVNLTLPPPAGESQMMSADPSVIVQMTSSAGMCWTSEFPSATRNVADQYKAKTP